MSKYCNECETTHPDAKYCPDCGTELETPPSREESGKKVTKETGSCEKCDSQISVKADRCPECDYEPSNSILVKLIGMVSIPVFLFSLLMMLIGIILVFDGLEIGTALLTITIFGVVATVSGVILWAWQNQDRRRPTDSTLF